MALQFSSLCAPEPFVAPSFEPPELPSAAIFFFIPKYFWLALGVFIIYFFHLSTLLPSTWLFVIHRRFANGALRSLPLPTFPLLLQLSPLERQLFSLRPDERLRRTIKMLFKCKGVCVRVRDISPLKVSCCILINSKYKGMWFTFILQRQPIWISVNPRRWGFKEENDCDWFTCCVSHAAEMPIRWRVPLLLLKYVHRHRSYRNKTLITHRHTLCHKLICGDSLLHAHHVKVTRNKNYNSVSVVAAGQVACLISLGFRSGWGVKGYGMAGEEEGLNCCSSQVWDVM